MNFKIKYLYIAVFLICCTSQLKADHFWTVSNLQFVESPPGSGIYNDRNQGFTIQGGYDLFGGFPANIANPDKNDRMWELHPSILDGDGVYHTLTTLPPFDTMVVDGFVIQGGQADGMGSLGKGAGLFNFGKLKLFNILFNGNVGIEGIDVYNNLNGYIEMNNIKCNSLLGVGTSVLHNEDGELRILSHSRIK